MRSGGSFVLACAALACVGLAYAQSGNTSGDAANAKASESVSAPSRGSANPKKDAKARPAITVTPEREAAVITFVQRNHAELADLLSYLKTNQPDEYERAIKEIFRTTERLDQIQDRDPLQYELEVASWKAQSRVQLLAARLKMGSNEDLVKQLRDALKTQNDAKLSLLKHERQRVADRLGKLDSDIARFDNDREKLIDRQLQLLTRSATEDRPAKLGPKNATKQAKKNANPPDNKPANQP